MAGAVRLGDMSRGHSDYPPRPNVSASSDVFVNNKGVHRKGDKWAVHCNHHPRCHDGSASSSSSSVFANSKGICRIGDSISCGDKMATGSSNVIVGG